MQARHSLPKAFVRTFLLTILCGLTCLAGQPQSATPNQQDVPQQQPPGTNNPDIGKQRRPAPAPPERTTPNPNSADVPQQQPGTNSPDVAKQRQGDSGSGTDSSTPTKKQTGSRKKAKRKATAS